MEYKEQAWAAVDIVIDLAKELGIKYRRGDFEIIEEVTETAGEEQDKNFVSCSEHSVTVILWFNFERTGKKLKARQENFCEYSCCRLKKDGIYFDFSLDEIGTHKGKVNGESFKAQKPISDVGMAQKANEENANSDRISENEIFSRLTQASKEAGVALTYAHKVFFLRLLEYAEKNGDETEDGYTVFLSVKKLAKALQIPFSTTEQSLLRLSSCGTLLREEEESPRHGIPLAKTTLLRKFYEKE